MNAKGLPTNRHRKQPPLAVESQLTLDVARHLAFALHRCVRQLHQQGVRPPREVEELTRFLSNFAQVHPGATCGAVEPAGRALSDGPDRLLVTKAEAGERLNLSVRTIERLVATGRLQQVQVERLARFRVEDLESFVNTLTGNSIGE